MQFTKLFNSILDSTIWQEPAQTKIVWITMLAMCDRYGDVFASVPGLASRAGVAIEECETAIECFLSPDRYSRTKDHDGRRIVEIDGGWNLLNHGKYRELLSVEERREYNRRKQAEYRQKVKPVKKTCINVNESQTLSALSTHTEAEADTETKNKRMAKPSLSQVSEYGLTLTPPFRKAEAFLAFYESNGWKVGKNTMKDWRAAVRTWNQKEKQAAAENARPIYQQTNGAKRTLNLWD